MSSAALLPVSSGHQEGTTKNQLSTLNGCYVPCLLNILGAVLYLRIGFAVGQMGMLGALGIMAVSEIIAYLTICSFSAIVTNGKMKGGGAYYMISRNLGPAFGGSSGLLFWFTYCINVTFNVVSFTETFIPTFLPQYDHRWGNIACSSITLFLLFIIAYMGAGAFAKVNVQLFVGLMISLGVGIGSIFFGQHEKTLRPV
jgi:potassium/chloride transporter 9